MSASWEKAMSAKVGRVIIEWDECGDCAHWVKGEGQRYCEKCDHDDIKLTVEGDDVFCDDYLQLDDEP